MIDSAHLHASVHDDQQTSLTRHLDLLHRMPLSRPAHGLERVSRAMSGESMLSVNRARLGQESVQYLSALAVSSGLLRTACTPAAHPLLRREPRITSRERGVHGMVAPRQLGL
jgi:hypothetical protein